MSSVACRSSPTHSTFANDYRLSAFPQYRPAPPCAPCPSPPLPRPLPTPQNSKMYGDQARFFDDELRPHLKHKRRGVVGMASPGEGLNASQFYITTGEELDSLDGKHTVFGQVRVCVLGKRKGER